MQQSFDFIVHDIMRWRKDLAPMLDGVVVAARRTPVGQLVKSMISGRTRDAVSLAAYRRLGASFGSAARIAAARVGDVAEVIADVTFAEVKAPQLVRALQLIREERPEFRLEFLGQIPVPEALAWLERLPGVGRKVAASTLNASTLARPVFIADSHVARVLRRLGLVACHAEPQAASEAVTAAMHGWNADDFLFFHIALKRLGQTVCRPEAPNCAACPIASGCPSRGR